MRRSDDELLATIEAEEQTAINWASGPLAEERAEALRRYNVEPYGNEVDGRSQVVSSDIRDAVEGVMPSLARVFLSGDEVGKFEPIGPEDQGAEIESEVVNWYIHVKNDGFATLYQALKDGLLFGNSYIKVWWQTDSSVSVERYRGLSDDEVTMLQQDADVKVAEHTEYPDPAAAHMLEQAAMMMGQQPLPPAPMLHDVTVERVKPDEYVAIGACPPDEVLVSNAHRDTSLLNADFVQARRELMIGELRDLGYKVDDNISDDFDNDDTPEKQARNRYDAWEQDDDDNPNDGSRRRVVLRETWIRLGDVDGKQTLWRICVVGKTILHKEEADCIPLASFSPILYPHSHVGVSYTKLVEDIAELNTTITRQFLDNLYLQNNSRSVVDFNRVNVDDMLVSRPGGIVRVEGDPGTAVMPLVTPDVGGPALNALQWLEALKENRTGVARVNQGSLDPNALNRTATGASLMVSAGQSRLELIARCFAGGVRDLFLLVHAIAQKHSTKPLQIRLNNKWTTVNPREWVRRTDFALSVALGTGAPEQQMSKLTAIGQFMQQGLQLGLVTPQNMYEWGKEFLRVAGYRSPDKFLTAPQPGQQPPPPQNPLLEVEKIKQQSEHAKLDKELQFKAQTGQQETQQKAALEQQRMTNEIQAQNAQAQADIAVEQYKVDKQAELERYKAELDAQTRLQIAEMQIRANAAIAAQRQIDGNPNNGEMRQ